MRGRRVRWLLSLAAVLSLAAALLPAHGTPAGTYPGGNGRILFQSNRDGDTEIYVMNADGSEQTNLTQAHDSADTRPAADPLDRGFLFTSNRDGARATFFQRWNGTVTKVTEPTDGDYDLDATFSPDGTHIAFTRWDHSAGVFQIHIAPFRGSPTQMESAFSDTLPQWSPDGTMIAFTRRTEEANHDIFYTDAALASLVPLLDTPTDDYEPQWSPDGSTIYYQSSNPDQTDIFSLTMLGASAQITDTPQPEYGPVPSPDGTWLLYERTIDGASQLILKDLLGLTEYQLTTDGTNSYADWMIERPPPQPSTVSFSYSLTQERIKVGGSVTPAAPGQRVIVKLFRKEDGGGKFRKLARKADRLSPGSLFRVRFSRRMGGTCKVTARYRGDADHTGATDKQKFRCGTIILSR